MTEVHRVPAELSSFVGRAGELAATGAAVRAGGVLTLVGPGGCGKTRLAVRTCHLRAGDWTDGVHWVGLEHESDPGQVVHRVTEALDVLLPAGVDPVEALVRGLRDRELLVAPDNCEHVPSPRFLPVQLSNFHMRQVPFSTPLGPDHRKPELAWHRQAVQSSASPGGGSRAVVRPTRTRAFMPAPAAGRSGRHGCKAVARLGDDDLAAVQRQERWCSCKWCAP